MPRRLRPLHRPHQLCELPRMVVNRGCLARLTFFILSLDYVSEKKVDNVEIQEQELEIT